MAFAAAIVRAACGARSWITRPVVLLKVRRERGVTKICAMGEKVVALNIKRKAYRIAACLLDLGAHELEVGLVLRCRDARCGFLVVMAKLHQRLTSCLLRSIEN